MDSVLLWTILVILVFSVTSAFLARRKKDRCLKDFNRYLITVQKKDSQRIWGRLAVDSSGFELRYRGNYWDQDHLETSDILYKEEFGSLFIVSRFLDELTPEGKNRRDAGLKRAHHPPPPRRFLRHLRIS